VTASTVRRPWSLAAGVLGLALVGVTVALGQRLPRHEGTSAAPVARSGTAGATAAEPADVAVAPAAPAPPATRAPRLPEILRPAPAPAAAPGRGDLSAYTGAGTWIDVFDFHPPHTNGKPDVTPPDVDRMAAAGVRTIYLQAARPEDPRAPGDLVAPDLLGQFLTRAHARGIRVVAWYLPHLSNLDDDMRHITATLTFSWGGHRFDGFGLDIEWRAAVPDHAARSAQLVELSRRIREAAGDRPVSAIVLPPVVTDVVNPAFWPGFPWAAIAPYYDVWLPMGYWTNRTSSSGWRDAARYTTENVRLLRQHLGDVPIHAIGGIGDAATDADYEAFGRVCVEQGLVGCSVYDWATSGPSPLPELRR